MAISFLHHQLIQVVTKHLFCIYNLQLIFIMVKVSFVFIYFISFFLESSFNTKTDVTNLDPLSKFILVRLEYIDDDSPSNILHRSAGFCKMSLDWRFDVLVSLTSNDEVHEQLSTKINCNALIQVWNIEADHMKSDLLIGESIFRILIKTLQNARLI